MKDLNKQSVIIGAKFKQLRQARGYTQGKVADILGVSSQHYGTLERGINAYSLDNILKLCDFYNVSVMSILGEIRKNDRKRKKECEKLISQIEELGDEHKEVVFHMVKFYRQLERRVEKDEERVAKEKELDEEFEKDSTELVEEVKENSPKEKELETISTESKREVLENKDKVQEVSKKTVTKFIKEGPKNDIKKKENGENKNLRRNRKNTKK